MQWCRKPRPGRPDCPQDQDVDWYEVAAGLWPESKANQLILHAALCNHCGPLLRAATSVDDEATPEEEKLLAELKSPSRPAVKVGRESIQSDPLASIRFAVVPAMEGVCTSVSPDDRDRSVRHEVAVQSATTLWVAVC